MTARWLLSRSLPAGSQQRGSQSVGLRVSLDFRLPSQALCPLAVAGDPVIFWTSEQNITLYRMLNCRWQ